MPFSPFGPDGYFDESVTHRPYWSTSGPWGPGQRYQKSSMLTYWKPSASRPEVCIAFASASITAAFVEWRKKLQLLQPRTGVSVVPAGGTASAEAGPAWSASAASIATSAAAAAVPAALRRFLGIDVSPCDRSGVSVSHRAPRDDEPRRDHASHRSIVRVCGQTTPQTRTAQARSSTT